MKKIFAAVLAGALVMLTACSNKSPTATSDFGYKVGTASYTHTNDSYGYTSGKNGRGAVSTTLVAAVFDNEGNIVRVSIDEVETNINFDSTGQLANFTAGEVKSKKELGDAYGMKAASSIGREWYQQVETLEKWLEGKAVNTIIGGATAKMGSMMDDNSVNPYTSGATGLPDDATGTGNSMARTASGTNSTNSSGANSGDGMMGDVMSGVNSMAEGVMDGANSMIDGMTDGNNYTGMATDTSWMDEDLKASVTIDTSNIMRAVEKAYKNAK